MSFEQTLEKYAALAVNVGVNIQPGQTLSISAPLEAVQFVRPLQKKHINLVQNTYMWIE